MASIKLDVISVPVSDQDRAKRFYIEVLGFTEVMDNPFDNRTNRWVMLYEDHPRNLVPYHAARFP